MIKLNERSDEFKTLEKEWYEEVKNINSKNKLNNFVNKVINGYEHDEGTYVHAVAVCTKAFIRLYGGGMDFLQANYLMWEIIRHTFDYDDKIGLKLISLENVLYPQLLGHFDIVIDEETHEKIIDTVKDLMEEHKEDAHQDVKEYWEKVVNGWLPDNFKVKEKKNKGVA